MINPFRHFFDLFIVKASRDLIRQPRIFVQFIGLLIISVGLTTFAVSAQSVTVISQTIVSEHWRGAYDLLVRPPSAVSVLEEKTGLVEGNYLGNSQEQGISMAQLDLVRSIPEVETAAPVATIGYLLNSTGGINISLPNPTLNVAYKMAYAIQDAMENTVMASEAYFILPQQDETDPGFPLTYGVSMGTAMDGEQILTVGQLPVQWTLVVGVDPVAEAALTGLDQAGTGSYLSDDGKLQQTISTFDPAQKAAKIPLLSSAQSFLDQTLYVKITSLDLSQQAISWQPFISPTFEGEYEKAWEGIFSQFALAPETVVKEGNVNLRDFIQPLSQQNLNFYLDREAEKSTSGYHVVTNTNVLLYPTPYRYEEIEVPDLKNKGLTLAIQSEGSWGEKIAPAIKNLQPNFYQNQPIDVPPEAQIFRDLKVLTPPAFQIDLIGQYDFEKLTVPNDPLSYVPLGIYEPPVVTLKYDEALAPLVPVSITPDLNPAGFIPRPPLGITNLTAAQYLTGREDFISAIRVRLSDIEGYTPENLTKVEKTAAEIMDRTGLHVDIVAGSSPQNVLVFVPGLGYVEENWTSLGAATLVTSGINTANLFLFIFFLLGAFLFITNSVQLSLQYRREEIGLLKSFGWQQNEILWTLVGELFILGAGAAILSGLLNWAIIHATGILPQWEIILAIFIIAPLLYLSAGFRPILQLTRQLPIKTLRSGGGLNEKQGFLRRGKIRNLIQLVIYQLKRRSTRSFLSLILIITGAVLSSLVINTLINLRGILKVSFLGNFVALEIERFHLLMIVAALCMSALVIFENLSNSVMERKREFGLFKAFGWSKIYIFIEILMEGLLVGFTGGFIGTAIGLLVFWVLIGMISTAIWMVSLYVWLGTTLIGGMSALYPAWQARNLSPQATLVEENLAVFNKRSKPSQTSAAVLALILVILFGSVLIGRRQDNGFRNIFSISETQNNDNQLSEYGVSSKNLITHIDRMLENGARTDRNEAEVLTAAYITDTLQKYGFYVSEEATATDLVTISDQNTAFEFYARGVFFHQQQVDPDEIVSGEIAFVPLNYALPPAKTVFGKILLIETSEEDQDFFAETAKKIVQNYDLNALQAVIFIKPTPEEMVLLTNYADGKAIASFKIGANITATLPGKKNPDQEIWITTHFDTAGETPGANYAAAGSAILLELARLLQADQPDSTIRLIAFSQSATHSGAVTFMNVHQNDLSKVKVVLDLDQLGMWDTLLVSNSLATGETLESIGEEDLKRLKEDGQFYLRSNWYRFINLDQPDFPEWLEALKTNKMGLSESPPVYFKMVVETAAALEIPIQKSSLPCIGQGPLLAGGFPAVGLCGQGNDIAGTAYDDRSNIDQDKLYKSATLAYVSIWAFMEEKSE